MKARESDRFALLEYIPYKLSNIAERSSFILASEYEPFGLSRPQFRVICYLNAYPHASSTEVVRATLMDKSRVSRAIDDLADRKLIVREKNASDRRSNLLNLTEMGEKLFMQIASLAIRIQNRFINSLNEDERQQLDRILIKLDAVVNQLEAEQRTEDLDVASQDSYP